MEITHFLKLFSPSESSEFRKTYGVFIAILLFQLFPFYSHGQQNVHTFYFHDDLKQYSTEYIPGTDDVVMAGTYLVTPTNSGVHFVIYDYGTNTLSVSKIFTIVNRDLRAVDIAIADASTYYITCLLRDNNTTNGKDRIKILKVDNTGTILQDELIQSAVTTGIGYRNMFPLHSVYYNDQLYICGYVGLHTYAYPAVPYYGGGDSKKAFALSYNPNTSGVTCTTWDYVYTTPAGSPSTDYDIAMRLVPIDENTMYVTGSCNFTINSNITGTDEFLSGTLSIFIDPATMTAKLIPGGGGAVYNQPFMGDYQFETNNNGAGEYGVGLIPDPDGNGYFVVGNDFDPWNPLTGIPSNGFDPLPIFYWLTFLDATNNYTVPFGAGNCRDRTDWDYAWVMQTLQGNSDNRFVLAGLTPFGPGNCYTNYQASYANLNPFLTEITPSYLSGNVGITTHFWQFYESRLGTGTIGVNNNNYKELGGGLSNFAWNPTFAAKYDDPDYNDFVINAPVFNPNQSVLNFKIIRTDAGGIVQDCSFNNTECEDVWADYNAIDMATANGNTLYPVSINEASFTVNVINQSTTGTNYPAGNDYICNSSHYRQHALTSGSQSAIARSFIFPNPANDEIAIDVESLGEETEIFTVSLLNLLGIEVAELYSGPAQDLRSKKLSVGRFASGLYMLKVSSEKKVVNVSKLIIN